MALDAQDDSLEPSAGDDVDACCISPVSVVTQMAAMVPSAYAPAASSAKQNSNGFLAANLDMGQQVRSPVCCHCAL